MINWGWQIGGFLFGIAFIVIAIFLAKLLYNLNKSAVHISRVLDRNERDIEDAIKNITSITENVDVTTDALGSFFNIIKLFKVFKKK